MRVRTKQTSRGHILAGESNIKLNKNKKNGGGGGGLGL